LRLLTLTSVNIKKYSPKIKLYHYLPYNFHNREDKYPAILIVKIKPTYLPRKDRFISGLLLSRFSGNTGYLSTIIDYL